MPSGMSRCRFCGQEVPSIYKKHHEEQCLVRRGLKTRDETQIPMSYGVQRTFNHPTITELRESAKKIGPAKTLQENKSETGEP